MNTIYLKKFGVHETGTAPYDGWTGNQNQNLYDTRKRLSLCESYAKGE